jgi:hypothetical protein
MHLKRFPRATNRLHMRLSFSKPTKLPFIFTITSTVRYGKRKRRKLNDVESQSGNNDITQYRFGNQTISPAIRRKGLYSGKNNLLYNMRFGCSLMDRSQISANAHYFGA